MLAKCFEVLKFGSAIAKISKKSILEKYPQLMNYVTHCYDMQSKLTVSQTRQYAFSFVALNNYCKCELSESLGISFTKIEEGFCLFLMCVL